MSKKEGDTFPKEWYDSCLDKLQEVKGIELKGDEFQPRQKALKELFENGREPEEVKAVMEYLEYEKGYDWSLMGAAKTHIAKAVAWKQAQEEEEQKKRERKFKNKTGPSVEKIEEFKTSFEKWCEKSAHGNSPWAFEFFLADSGVISFDSLESGWKNITIHDVARFQKATKLYEGLKEHEDTQIENEKINEKLNRALEQKSIGQEL